MMQESMDSGEELKDREAANSLQKPIKQALKDALEAASTFDGAYALSETYRSSTAVNPCLNIDGFGTVGLPLSTEVAIRLRSFCTRIPSGTGQSPEVDKEPRDTCELEPHRVQFSNPDWNSWLRHQVLPKVCRDLGIKDIEPFPRCELRKLLIYESGSHSTPYGDQGTDKADGIFATMVIVLPSKYAGGQVHVRLGRESKVFDSSSTSLFATTVLAWYADVANEVKPITDGYRLALHYSLIHPTPSSIPSLPSLEASNQAIGQVLRAWRHMQRTGVTAQDGGPPRKLAHILKHEYTDANLSFDQLKGSDAMLASDLRATCDAHGYRLALGRLDYTVRGIADDDRNYDDGEDDGSDDNEGQESDDVEVDMLAVTERECKIAIVNGPFTEFIGGQEARLDLRELMVADHYFEIATPDDKDYEPSVGLGAGSLEHFYHRTILLIWPNTQDASIITAFGGTDAAIKSLEICTSPSPSSTESTLAEVALRAADAPSSRIVADAAVLWEDAELWKRAVASCQASKSVDAFGREHYLYAYKGLGFQATSQILEELISNTASNAARLDFVAAIQDESYDEEPEDAPKFWCEAKKTQILSTLRQPAQEDIATIISHSLEIGALKMLRNLVLPQIIACNVSVDWWLGFFQEMDRVELSGGSEPLKGWAEPVFKAATPAFDRTLLLAPTNAARFDVIKQLEATCSAHPEPIEWCRSKRRWAIKNLRSPCKDDGSLLAELVRGDNSLLTASLLPKICAGPFIGSFWVAFVESLSGVSEIERDGLPSDWQTQVLEALETALSRAIAECHTNHERFALLERFTTASSLHSLSRGLIERCRRTILDGLMDPVPEDVPYLLGAIKGDKTYGLESLLPQLSTLKCTFEFWQRFIRTVKEEEAYLLENNWQSDAVTAFIRCLVELAVSRAVIVPVPQEKPVMPKTGFGKFCRPRQDANPQTPAEIVNVINWFALCIKAGHAELASGITEKLMSACTDADSVTRTIMPVMSALQQTAEIHKISRDSVPFSEFFRRAIGAYITLYLGAKPAIPSGPPWCTCADCQEVRRQLEFQQGVIWRAAKHRRLHVERTVRSQLAYTVTTNTAGHPHGVQVTQGPALVQLAAWKKRSELGVKLFKGLGNEQIIQNIWAMENGGSAAVLRALETGCLSPSGSSPPAEESYPNTSDHAPTIPQKRKAVCTAEAIDLTMDDD